MNLFSKTAPKLFNILSIGQRGVGKTVFLAGSYAQLQANQERQGQLWFECSDPEAQKNLEGISSYIAANKQYPPPTMKITDFNFDLKHRDQWGTKTLCKFRWWDIPGEVCRIEHPDFQQMVLNSHSCCILINAYALVSDSASLQNLEGIIKQVVAIASLVDQHRLDYKFALVFTQCDRLESGFLSQIQIEENLQPLISRLDQAKAKYQKFYSSIPIVQEQGGAVLRGSGAAEALLWLLLEKRSARLQQDLGSGLAQKKTELALPGGRRRNAFLLLAGSSLLGVIAFLFFGFGLVTQRSELVQDSEAQVRKYQQVLEVDPNNLSALFDLSDLYLERGEVNQAIPIMERIVQQNPENLEGLLTLAQLYELTNQKTKAEDVYDQILDQQENNLVALIGKAMLRSEQGDRETAESLFARAEQAAVTEDLKAEVRALAQTALTPASQ
jgi:tetratricopeptide (TPR) repeat protein